MAMKIKKKLKFRVKKLKNNKNFKDFNLDEINLFLKIKNYNLENIKKNTNEKVKTEVVLDEEALKREKLAFIITKYGTEAFIEKDLIKLRIKKWKFLNFAEFKLWSVIYDIWKDVDLTLDLQGTSIYFQAL